MTRTPRCMDRTCPMDAFEHDAHDGRMSRTPTGETCTDPGCDMAWVEHEAHLKTIEGETR